MAVTITPQEFAASLGMQAHGIEPLLRAVSIMVLQYTEDAPDDIANQAVIRAGAWLSQTPAASVRSDSRRRDLTQLEELPGHVKSEEQTATFAVSQQGALRHSGAMSLLSRYKVRRAGAVNGSVEESPVESPVTSTVVMKMGTSAVRTFAAGNLGFVGTIDKVELPAVLGDRIGFWIPDPESDTVVSFQQEGNPFGISLDSFSGPIELTLNGDPGKYWSTPFPISSGAASYQVTLS